jgi:[ribosomal protein S5]-alanine N-acetyltransferase
MEIEEIYSDLPILETESLILRRVTLDDAEDMFSYGSNEDVSKYLTWNTHKTLSDTNEFINFVLNQYQNSQVSPWGIEYKENGKFIGTIDFIWWQPNHRIAEIGYVISQEY